MYKVCYTEMPLMVKKPGVKIFMRTQKYTLLFLAAVPLLGGCFPSEFQIVTEQKTSTVLFYPGGDILDDLLIIDGVNYFGKAQYQIDDPLGDLGFRFTSGQRVRAECAQVGKNLIGEDECKLYEVYRSNFELIPEGVRIPSPQMF
jgi:hypothetical protein